MKRKTTIDKKQDTLSAICIPSQLSNIVFYAFKKHKMEIKYPTTCISDINEQFKAEDLEEKNEYPATNLYKALTTDEKVNLFEKFKKEAKSGKYKSDNLNNKDMYPNFSSMSESEKQIFFMHECDFIISYYDPNELIAFCCSAIANKSLSNEYTRLVLATGDTIVIPD